MNLTAVFYIIVGGAMILTGSMIVKESIDYKHSCNYRYCQAVTPPSKPLTLTKEHFLSIK